MPRTDIALSTRRGREKTGKKGKGGVQGGRKEMVEEEGAGEGRGGA